MSEESCSIDGTALASVLQKGGTLDAMSEHFEERPSQINLLKRICETFNEGNIGVFEAGTGVGKSFAYLIPAIEWAVAGKTRVVVSTGTINLQQQLIDKDIPLAEKMLGRKIRAVLVKGRQNFVCIRRLDEALAEKSIFAEEESAEIELVKKWVETTETGSRSDLTFEISNGAWSHVASETDGCMFGKCPHFGRCFVMKMRKAAADAQLLVVNHHLLFADLEARSCGVGYEDAAVLPAYRRVIFDEAHGIEDAATSFFSQSLTQFALSRQLNLLYRAKRKSVSGHLLLISAMSKKPFDTDEIAKKISAVQDAYSRLENAALDDAGEKNAVRITSETSSAKAISKKFDDFRSKMTALCNALREFLAGFEEN